jgi:hypothetical protein
VALGREAVSSCFRSWKRSRRATLKQRSWSWRKRSKAAFYERSLGLQDAHLKFLEWSDAEKAKKIEVLEKEKEELEKKYQDVLDDNKKQKGFRMDAPGSGYEPERVSHVLGAPSGLVTSV